jgi:hypothetical protein
VFGPAAAANSPTVTGWPLTTADHVLHGVLFVLGLSLVLMLYRTPFERSRAVDDPEGR